MKFDPPLTAEELRIEFKEYEYLVPKASGGQGTVFQARRPGQNGTTALKIYFPGSHQERTQREIDALRLIRCENITRLESSGKVILRGCECVFVGTEFIEGITLSEALKAGKLSENMVVKIGVGVSNAIDELWRQRIVHRDIKPDNIMLRSSGDSVLIDLGVARHLGLESLTTMGHTWGTSGYMSPEHAAAVRQLSCKTDVFSMGILLQECLLGYHPTRRDQRALMFGGIPTATLAPSVPLKLCGLIDAMLMHRPEFRPRPDQVNTDFLLYNL